MRTAILVIAFLVAAGAHAWAGLVVTATDNGVPLVFTPSVDVPGSLVGSFTDGDFTAFSVAVGGVPLLESPDLGTVTLQISNGGAVGHTVAVDVTQTGLSQPAGFAGADTMTANNLVGGAGPTTETFGINGSTINSFTFPATPGAYAQAFPDSGLPAISTNEMTFTADFTAADQLLELTQAFQSAVPEPGSWSLFTVAALLLIGWRARQTWQN